MKKLILILAAMLIIASAASLSSFSAPKPYDMPKAAAAPAIDGKIDAKEWNNALVVELKKGDAALFVASGVADTFGGAKFRFMWSDAGIYFAAEVSDTTKPTKYPPAGKGSYNSGDGIQFNIYSAADVKGSTKGELLFFSYVPKADDGKPAVGEHFVYGTGSAGAEVPAAKIAAVMNGETAYVIEGLIPAESFAKINKPVTIKSGTKIYMNNVVMELDSAGKQSLIVDNEWFDGGKSNVYTLTDTLAGNVPVTEAAKTPASGAAQTSDFALALGLGAASLSFATMIILKKKRRA